MQLINIDEIIDELKKTSYWNNYESFLGNDIFYKKDILLGLFESGKIIHSGVIHFCKWEDRETLFKVFKNLELEFIKLFLEKVKFCPYCGKHSLISYENLNNEKKRFFDLDHIFPKNSYGVLTYNFYNLIPSCKLCNQAKSTKNFIKNSKIGDKIFHPYFGYIIKQDGRKYKSKFLCKIEDFCLDLNDSHSDFFKLNKIYPNSQDTENDKKFIRNHIEKILAEELSAKKFGLSYIKKDRINFYFKHFYPETEQEILKFSNGKLKKDLIENLKL